MAKNINTRTENNIKDIWAYMNQPSEHRLPDIPAYNENSPTGTLPPTIDVNGVKYFGKSAISAGANPIGMYAVIQTLNDRNIDYKYLMSGFKRPNGEIYPIVAIYAKETEDLGWIDAFVKRIEASATVNGLDDIRNIEATDDHKNRMNKLTAKQSDMIRQGFTADVKLYAQSEIDSMTAFDRCYEKVNFQPLYIKKDGKLLMKFMNTRIANCQTYATAAEASDVAIVFAEDAYGTDRQKADGYATIYVEVAKGDDPWELNSALLLSLAMENPAYAA